MPLIRLPFGASEILFVCVAEILSSFPLIELPIGASEYQTTKSFTSLAEEIAAEGTV